MFSWTHRKTELFGNIKILLQVVQKRGHMVIASKTPIPIGHIYTFIETDDGRINQPLIIQKETTKEDCIEQIKMYCELTNSKFNPDHWIIQESKYFYILSTD